MSFMTSASSAFGAALKLLRRELGLSQAALALALETTQRHVSFLETGRSQPSRDMVGRIATGLSLSVGQRAALFEASGFRNPYPSRTITSDDVKATLDLISTQILSHWPFPAFVLDRSWTILRMNARAERMLGPFMASLSDPLNVLELFLSEAFRGLIVNWEEASAALFFRLQAAALQSEVVANALAVAKARGDFEHISTMIAAKDEIPIFVPTILRTPSGMLRMSSFLGRLGAVNDALVEGFEIELMVPLDEDSEALLAAI